MNLKSRIEYQKHKEQWDERLELVLDVENNYRKEYQKLLQKYYNRSIEEFKNFFTDLKFKIETNTQVRLEAKLKNLMYLIKLEDVSIGNSFTFGFSKVDAVKTDYHIIIQPFDSKYYYPHLSEIRECSKDLEQMKQQLKIIDEDYLLIKEKINDLSKLELFYSYRNSESSMLRTELDKFLSFTEILQKLA